MSAPKKIIFDAAIGEGSSPFFGTITLKNIRHADDDAPVTVREYLGVRFQLPELKGDVAVQAILHPFQATKLEAATKTEGALSTVTAKVRTEGPHTFGANDALVWNVNTDLTGGRGEDYLKGFEVWADEVSEEGKESKE
jgi:hypothetical protein